MIDDFYQSLLDDKRVKTFRITIYTIMYEGSCKSGLVITLNRLEYAIEKNHFLIRKTKSRKELFSFGISTCTFLNRTAYVSEQRKQQNKQHGFEICYTELLYLFVYSNKILISGLKKATTNFGWHYIPVVTIQLSSVYISSVCLQCIVLFLLTAYSLEKKVHEKKKANELYCIVENATNDNIFQSYTCFSTVGSALTMLFSFESMYDRTQTK